MHHRGFDRADLRHLARDVGFAGVRVTTGARIEREDGVFPLFLLTGRRA